MVYNIMTCVGPGWDFSVLSGCSMAWFSIAIIVILALVIRRQCMDGLLSGTSFNIIGAFLLGIGGAFAVVTITGDARWTLLTGLAGIAIGGMVGGMVLGGGGEDYG